MLIPILVAGLIGVLAGSVVNALADDLPQYRRPRLPHYPDDTPRPPIAWLGITAFLSGKRTSPGGAKLSWRYPLTEIGTALLMIVTVLRTASNPQVSGLQVIFWLAYMAIFALITVIDLEHRLILFSVIIPSALLAVLDAILTPTADKPNLQDALLGGAMGFGVFFLFYLGGALFVRLRSRGLEEEIQEIAFGYGDVMLATFAGLVLGWQPMFFTIFVTVFLGAIISLAYIGVARLMGQRLSITTTALPYGPFIVAGTFAMLLFASDVRLLLWGR